MTNTAVVRGHDKPHLAWAGFLSGCVDDKHPNRGQYRQFIQDSRVLCLRKTGRFWVYYYPDQFSTITMESTQRFGKFSVQSARIKAGASNLGQTGPEARRRIRILMIDTGGHRWVTLIPRLQISQDGDALRGAVIGLLFLRIPRPGKVAALTHQ